MLEAITAVDEDIPAAATQGLRTFEMKKGLVRRISTPTAGTLKVSRFIPLLSKASSPPTSLTLVSRERKRKPLKNLGLVASIISFAANRAAMLAKRKTRLQVNACATSAVRMPPGTLEGLAHGNKNVSTRQGCANT
jgi:hypothetical protein